MFEQLLWHERMKLTALSSFGYFYFLTGLALFKRGGMTVITGIAPLQFARGNNKELAQRVGLVKTGKNNFNGEDPLLN